MNGGRWYVCYFIANLFFGADFTDFTVFVVAIEIQAPEFLLPTILRRRRFGDNTAQVSKPIENENSFVCRSNLANGNQKT